jgi:hypothetical protein
MDYSEMILESVNKKLEQLTWKCTGCQWIRQCEDEGGNPGSRYCYPIIEAAILNKENFKQPTGH